MGHSRVRRDMLDKLKVIAWFQSHNPFAWPSQSLCSPSSGFTAIDGDGINCDDAVIIGTEVINSMTSNCYTDIVLRKKSTVKTLAHLQKGVPVDGYIVHINCNNLFS